MNPIRELLSELDISQTELARMTGISLPSINDWYCERKGRGIGRKNGRKLCAAFPKRFTLPDLLAWEPGKRAPKARKRQPARVRRGS